MGRIIGENLRNELKIYDPVSSSNMVLHYRLPTVEERIAYSSTVFERDGDKLKVIPGKSRHEFGSEILTGFEEGAFLKESSEGLVKFSSDPQSEFYDPNWKTLVVKYASDLLDILAQTVFEGARATSSQMEIVIQKNS